MRTTMTDVGFDGKARRKPPLTAIWLASSFVLTVLYWLACLHWLPDLTMQIFAPYSDGPTLQTAAIVAGPFAVTFGLAFPFRIAERDFWFWIMMIFVAEMITGFASACSLAIAAAIGI